MKEGEGLPRFWNGCGRRMEKRMEVRGVLGSGFLPQYWDDWRTHILSNWLFSLPVEKDEGDVVSGLCQNHSR